MTGARGQGSGVSRADRPAVRLLPLFVVLSLVVPVFAHGCHAGDHDDEPAVAPPVRLHEPR